MSATTTNPVQKESRSKREGRRALVLDEAAKAFNRRGVSQASLAQVAKSVGVSRAALYYYVEDQEDLVYQCYVRTCELLAGILDSATSKAHAVMDIIDLFIEGALDDSKPEFASMTDVAFLRLEQRNTVLGLYKGLRATLADLIAKGVALGELRPCDPRIVASAIIGLITWVPVVRRWRATDQLSQREFIDTVKDLLRRGAAADRKGDSSYTPFELSGLDLPVGSVFDPEARAMARREALLASASWLFNLKGVDATSLDEVALRVGVTKKVIYHNMGGKETLVTECYRRSFRFFEDIGKRVIDYDGSRIDALCAGLHGLAEASLREDIAPLVPMTGHESWPLEEREELEETSVRMLDIYLITYKQAQKEGSVRKVNARAVVPTVPGIYDWLPKWYDALDAQERERAPRELAELYRIGLEAL